jgi:hypothetical protein
MDRRTQIEAGPVVTATGGLLVVVSLFLDWYEPGISGWTVFEVLDLLLFALGGVAIAGLAERLGMPVPAITREPLRGAAIPLVGALAVVVVASQVVGHPPAAIDRNADVGQWLALGGAGLVLAGALLGSMRLSFSVNLEAKRTSSGPDDPTQQLGRSG